MKESIKKRIESVRRGEVPEGYRIENGYLISDDWKTVPMSSRFTRSTQKNSTGCENVLTISAQMGLVNQREFYDKDIASEDKSGYFLMKNGEFAYNKSYSTGYPYGAIKQLTKYDEGIVSPLYICFAPKAGTNTAFYTQYFEGGRYNREIYRVAQEGARNHGLLNIAVEDFFTGILVEPSAGEQQKIAKILATCDRMIELTQQLLEEKRRQKQWLMRTLLNPESGVRLPGFEEEWSTGSFSGVCTFINGRAYKQDELLEKGKYPVLRVGNLFTKSDWYYSDMELPAHMYIDNGDLIYAWSASFGPQIWAGEKVIFHYHIWKVLPNNVVCKEYLYQYFLYDVDQLSREQQGGTMAHITKESMEKRVCKYPTIAEQQRIAEILDTADQDVLLAENNLEFWQQRKKALMQLLLTGLLRVNA